MNPTKEMEKKVEDVLEQVRPYLQADGGDVSLIEITKDKRVLLELMGACKTCNMSHMTFKAGIEEAIRKVLPDVKGVESVSTSEMQV